MANPVCISVEVEYTESQAYVYAWFDRDIDRVNNSIPWENGFTILVNDVNTSPNTVTKLFNGLKFTVPAAINNVIKVAYSGTNLKDIQTSDLVEQFQAQQAALVQYDPDANVSAYAVVLPNTTPQRILIKLNSLIVSTHGFETTHPFSVLVQSVPTTIQTVEFADAVSRTYTIKLASPVSAGMPVVVRVHNATNSQYLYNARTQTKLSSTNDIIAWNSSSYGLPTSTFGSSCIMQDQLNFTDNVITATIRVFLNPMDREVVRRFSPTWDPSGSFAANPGPPPIAYVLTAPVRSIHDGAVYVQQFAHADLALARQAALEWLQVSTVKIQFALNAARQLYQNLTVPPVTYTYI